jgi:hypothetical protein
MSDDQIFGLLLLGIIPNALLIFIGIRRYFERNIAQGNIHFDYDKFEREMDETFAPVSLPASRR